MSDNPDALDTVARYAPTALLSEWTHTRADATLLAVLEGAETSVPGPAADAHEISLQAGPGRAPTRHRHAARVLPVAASLAVLAGGLLVAVLHADGGGRPAAERTTAGQPFDPPTGLSGHALGRHRYSYRVAEQFAIDRDGRIDLTGAHRTEAMTSRSYLAANGDVTSVRVGRPPHCRLYRHVGDADLANPDSAFFAALPTDVYRLNTYFLDAVHGSTSRDEAVFAAVGDTLRTADGLASPRLRAAMLAVLSRTPGVRLHFAERDHLGRSAIRADFVDPANRGGEVQSLYFDPDDFRLLEQRESDLAAPAHAGPSPAYTAAPPADADDPDDLTGPGFVELVRTERVVRHAPRCG